MTTQVGDNAPSLPTGTGLNTKTNTMKKKLFGLAIAMTATFGSFAQNTTVTFRFTGINDGETVGLNLIDGKQHAATNTATVKDGKAVVALDIPQGHDGRAYYITIKDKAAGNMLVLKAGENATLTGNVTYMSEYPRINGLNVTGSPTHTDYNAKKLDRNSLNVIYEEYHKNPVLQKIQEAGNKKDTAEVNRLRQSAEWKKFEADEARFFAKVDSTFKAVHKANKDTWYGPLMLLTDYSFLSEAQKPEYEQLGDAAKNSFYGKIVKNEIFPPSITNQPAPDFTLKDSDGNTVQLSKLRGKIVVLDFWATWCGPCKRSLPAMKMAVDKYKNDPDVVFLFIHTWENGSAEAACKGAKAYLNDNGFGDFHLVMDTKDPKTKINNAVSAFGVKGIPAKFVIDKEGKIRFELTGFSGTNEDAVAELSEKIEIARNAQR